MIDYLAFLFRGLCYPIVSISWLYLPGMVLVRLSRMLRKYFYSPSAGVEYRVVCCAGKAKMAVDRNSYMGGSIYWSGFHHLQELLYLDKQLKKNMVFVDVGANQGEFALFAAMKLTEGKVLAFEPVTKNRELLKENIKLNALKNLGVFNYGLSDKKGSFPIYTSTDASTFHGIHEGLSTLFKSGGRNEVEENISLEVFDDCFNAEEQVISFIKIDVEGAELFALKGMHSFLEKYHPEILIEINEETFNAAGYNTADVLHYLESFGYKPFKIYRGRLKSIDRTALSAWGNYIFRVDT